MLCTVAAFLLGLVVGLCISEFARTAKWADAESQSEREEIK